MAGVLLHGRDRSPEEMIDLAARLDLTGVRWVVPTAPPLAGDVTKPEWYPKRFTDPIAANEPALSEAVEICAAAVEEASEAGRIDASRIFVVGFSQGACLALEYALRRPWTCGPLVAFTGALMGCETEIREGLARAFEERPVMITGSDVDEWVAESHVQATAAILAQNGARVVLRSYPGRPHSIAKAEIDDARDFLSSICKAEQAWFLKKRLRSLIA
jgi:predicted esterase